jgi:single-strand DNA-binding protein
MAPSNLNRVVLTGNLTKDPELRSTSGGTPLCSLRVACNTRRKDPTSGEWVDKPNYFDVTVWGAQAESCAAYLQKGRPVAIDGRLEWREWEAPDGSGKRQATSIVAERVQFLGTRDAAEGDGRAVPQTDVPTDTAEFDHAAAGGGFPNDDDLPF